MSANSTRGPRASMAGASFRGALPENQGNCSLCPESVKNELNTRDR